MRILVDADSCPVTKLIECAAKEYAILVLLFCDTNHVLNSDYSQIKIIGASQDAVDLALFNELNENDVVVTQDYGVACMALGKKAFSIHPSGRWYTKDNIDKLLMERHIAGKARRGNKKCHIKGPKKRTKEDDSLFMEAFLRLIQLALDTEKENQTK